MKKVILSALLLAAILLSCTGCITIYKAPEDGTSLTNTGAVTLPGATTATDVSSGLTTDSTASFTTTAQPTVSGTTASFPTLPAGNDLGAVRAAPVISDTYIYNGGFFSMELPNGWVVDTTGEYIYFGFRAYDPENPDREFFYYGKQDIFLKSQNDKAVRTQLASLVPPNDSMGYHLFADAPVLNPATVENYYGIYNDFSAYLKKYGVTHKLLVINNLNVIETFKEDGAVSPYCLDNSVIRASFTSERGTECQAMLGGQIINYITDMASYPGADMGFYVVYSSCGIISPTDEFIETQETLLRCLASFTFTEEYVQASISSITSQTDAILANARATAAVYDSYNAAWNARQTTYDIASQKYSDATLGYDRLYDSNTGEIYRAQTGFYDNYNSNRSDYTNQNLQLVDDSSSQYYLDPVDYYID